MLRSPPKRSETKKRSDELHAWLNARKEMFRELEDVFRSRLQTCLRGFPLGRRAQIAHLGRSVRDRARPCRSFEIVTEEKPTRA